MNHLLSELLKTKRSSFFLIIILLQCLLVTIFFIDFFSLTIDEFYSKLWRYDDKNPCFYYYKTNLYVMPIMLPIIASVITFSVKNIEDKANGWKSIFTLPRSVFKIHLDKFFVVSIYLFSYVFLSFCLLMVSAFVLSILKPDFNFGAFPFYFDLILILGFKYLVSALAVGSFTYCFLIFFRRVITGLLSSIFFPLIGVFIEYSFNLYNSSFTQTFVLLRLRSDSIRENGSAERFDFSYDFYSELLLIIWILFSWSLIYFQSKRPKISYY